MQEYNPFNAVTKKHYQGAKWLYKELNIFLKRTLYFMNSVERKRERMIERVSTMLEQDRRVLKGAGQ